MVNIQEMRAKAEAAADEADRLAVKWREAEAKVSAALSALREAQERSAYFRDIADREESRPGPEVPEGIARVLHLPIGPRHVVTVRKAPARYTGRLCVEGRRWRQGGITFAGSWEKAVTVIVNRAGVLLGKRKPTLTAEQVAQLVALADAVQEVAS